MVAGGSEFPETENEREGGQSAPHFIAPEQSAALALRRLFGAARQKLRFWLSEEEAFGSRFLLLPFFLGIGIVIYFTLPFEPDWRELAALCLFFAVLGYLLRRRRFFRLGCSFAFAAALGALAAKSETARAKTIMLENSGLTFITVRILALEPQDNGNIRILAETLSSRNPPLRPMPGKLQLLAPHLPRGAALGGGLQGLVLLRGFSGPARPNGYDFAFQNYFRGIGGQGRFIGAPQAVAAPLPGLRQKAALKLAAWRRQISGRIEAAIPGEAGAVAAALITGERAGIAPATNHALRAAGLAHILSISGLHMAMVIGMALLVCRRFLALFPVFSSYFPPGKIAAFFALFAAAAYLALSGAAIAAERSFIMALVMLLAVIADKTAISLRNLAVSGIFILLWRPHEILSPGFQMSFAATAALIAAFGAWSAHRRAARANAEEKAAEYGRPLPPYKPPSKLRARCRAWLIVPCVSTCLSSLAAGAAGGLYSAYHFNNTAPYGMISNALALPIMAVLVMPFAMLGTLLMPLHLEAWPLRIMGIGIVGIEKIAAWVAGFSPDGNLGALPPLSLALLTAGMVFLIFLRSPLRFSAVLFIIPGCWLYGATPQPLALTAENGRLAAVFNSDNSLSLNTNRPSAFTARIWQTAYAAGTAAPPQIAGQKPEAWGGKAEKQNYFNCDAAFCRARLRNGSIFTISDKAESSGRAFAAGNIILLNFMMTAAEDREWHALAARHNKIIISRSDLALFGAAEIRLASPLLFWRGRRVEVAWAAGNPARPWNSYRRFAKRARGLPA